jgi:ABC-2 type transport system permease protein
MTASATASRAAAPALHPPSLRARLLGLGSIFGKSFRDSRRSALLLGGLFLLVFVATASQVAEQFDTLEERIKMAAELSALPAVFQGLLGEPIGIEHLGGFLSWRLLNFMPVTLGIWSIVAMSGLLGAEVSRGSMDLVASAPISRARIALQKLLGYLVALAVAILLLVVGMVISFQAFATLPGDAVGIDAILAHAAWLYLATLVPGAVAFALAPLAGRGTALGIAATVLFGSFIVNGFAASVSAFETVKPISYFAITAAHRPLAGSYDWASIGGIAAASLALLAVGVLAFARRDLLVPTGGRIRLPTIPIFLREPFTRALGERLPSAVVWGLGLGLFGLFIASSADQFVATIGQIPQVVQMIKAIFPNDDILSTGGFLQLAFFSEAIIIIGLAAGGFVGAWASDESERRLEVVLGAPIGRTSWALRSASAVLVAIVIMTAVMTLGVVVGAASQAGNPVDLVPGMAVLGLYGMALAGIGLAVGGLVRPSLAAPVTIVLGLAFYLLDVIGSILDLPDVVLDLALNRHLGRPILGSYDEVGLVVCAALAIGGVLLCALGMRRRDIGR